MRILQRSRFFLLLMIFAFSGVLSAQEVLNPQEVAKLYFKTMNNADNDSRLVLNEYLSPLFKGKKAFPKEISIIEKLSEDLQKSFLSQLKPQVAKEVKTAAKDYYDFLFSLPKTANCSVRKSVSHENFVRVHYKCGYVLPLNNNILTQDIARLSAQELKKLLQGAKKNILVSSKGGDFSAYIDLYRLEQKGKIYYYSDKPLTLTLTLIDHFLLDLEK